MFGFGATDENDLSNAFAHIGDNDAGVSDQADGKSIELLMIQCRYLSADFALLANDEDGACDDKLRSMARSLSFFLERWVDMANGGGKAAVTTGPTGQW